MEQRVFIEDDIDAAEERARAAEEVARRCMPPAGERFGGMEAAAVIATCRDVLALASALRAELARAKP